MSTTVYTGMIANKNTEFIRFKNSFLISVSTFGVNEISDVRADGRRVKRRWRPASVSR
jgi:hypothetical protein